MAPPGKPAAPKGTSRPRRTAPRHLIGAAADKENTASGLISTEAALCGVDAGEWAQVRAAWQSTCHSTERMPGYEDSNGGHLQCNDFYTLHPAQMLNDEVISEITRRICLNEPTLAFLNSWNLEKMFPLREQGHGQMLSRRTWGHLVGRRIRSEVRIVAAMHYVPGHWCLSVFDFGLKQASYYDPLCGCRYADGATSAMRKYLSAESNRQDEAAMGALLLDEDSFPLTNFNHPKQPDGVSCGVCCLLMLEVLARSPEAFYSLARSGRNFTPNEILTARAKWACALLTRPHGDGNSAAQLSQARVRDTLAEQAQYDLDP